MKGRSVLAIAVLLLVAPTSALAERVLAPPGKAGADQYFETIPSSAGNAKPPSGSAAGSGGTGFSAATRDALSRSKNGRAAAAFAAATAPGPGSMPAGASSTRGAEPGSTALRPLGGSDAGGLGIALPILAATIALAMIGVALAARRDRRDAI